MSADDWYKIAKYTGIALSALLGAVAVFGDFRTQDKTKISVPGYLMIFGVIAACMLTVIATYHEDHAQDAKTREIVANTGTTVTQIRELLSQIVDPSFTILMERDCNAPSDSLSPSGQFACGRARQILTKYIAVAKKHPRGLPPGVAIEGTSDAVAKDHEEELGFKFYSKAMLTNELLGGFVDSASLHVSLIGDNGEPAPASPGKQTAKLAEYSFDLRKHLISGGDGDLTYMPVENGKRILTLSIYRIRPTDNEAFKAISIDGLRDGVFEMFVSGLAQGFNPEAAVMYSSNGQFIESDKFSRTSVDRFQARIKSNH